MKKRYSKPLIAYEDFCLSANIAGNCEVKTGTPSLHMCAYTTVTGNNVFLSGVGQCTTTEQDGEHNGICYHIPYSTFRLFNS